MLLPKEAMFNESSSKLQSDGRPVSPSVGDGILSADNVKTGHHPSASPCFVKCLLQRLCSLFRPSKCSPAVNTHPTTEEQSASEPAGMTQADNVPASDSASMTQADNGPALRTASQSDGSKNDWANEGNASSRPSPYKPQGAPASFGPTRCKPHRSEHPEGREVDDS